MPSFELAQFNVARARGPLDSRRMQGFVDNLERINALADTAPGFVWRLQTDAGDATGLRPYGEDMLVNLSVWSDLASLRDFVYRSAHVEVMKQRQEWFERLNEVYLVLWWVPGGHRPGLAEAEARLKQLRKQGPGPEAFNFKKAWPAPDTARRPASRRPA